VRERPVTIAACLGLATCSRGGAPTRDAASDAPMPHAIAGTTPSAPPTAIAFSPRDASSSCRILRGPIELPLRGPAALSLRGDTIDVVEDDNGHPLVLSLPAGAIPASVAFAPEPLDGGSAAGMTVACAVAGDKIFCPDKSGGIHRTARDGADDRIVASARAGTRIAATVVGGTHIALSYLSNRRTSEGWVSEAWLVVDDDSPVRLSEDGSGATAVALSSRGSSALALLVDARAALTAMHVRPFRYDRHVLLEEDAVVFVGGPGERRTAGALVVPASGPAWALLPIGKDIRTFGLAVVRVDDPPRVDEPSSWSIYPNGLDPSPVAGACGGRVWVALARPQSSEPGSPRVLEIGEVVGDGSIAPQDAVPLSGIPTHTAVVVDERGALWISWVDGSGCWLERMACK
jgi:hypothetical protein